MKINVEFHPEITRNSSIVSLLQRCWSPENVIWGPKNVTQFSENVSWFPENVTTFPKL